MCREATGEKRRQQGQEHAKKRLMQTDPAFREAVEQLNAHTTKVGLDYDRLLAAMRVRRRVYGIMFAFYGSSINTRARSVCTY